jgi:hypothetical protein
VTKGRDRLKKTARWTGRVVLALVILLAFAIGFGTPQSDADKMRAFADAVEHWQHNPDFRKVQIEYVESGVQAMRTRTCGLDSTRTVMWLRSLPGLPEAWAVNDTSLAHYTSFTRGPISAYLHLCNEQGMSDTLKMLKDLGQYANPSDAQIREFIAQFKLYYPVASDAGAVESVRLLLRDVDAARGFADMPNVTQAIRPHIAAIAKSLGYPEQPNDMTPAQQHDVWVVLDDTVKERDYELWRLKQVNDWLNGVWAQVYGKMYAVVIYPTLKTRDISRVAAPLLLMAWLALAFHRRRRAAEQILPALQPQLAIEGPNLPPDNRSNLTP